MNIDWKKKTMAVLLAGSVILGGCRTKDTKESSLETEEESTTSQSETTARDSKNIILEMPDDKFFEKLRNDYDVSGYCLDSIIIGENGRYRNVDTAMFSDPFQSDMYVAFLFSEEGYNFMKDKDEHFKEMSLDQYREYMQSQYPKYTKILDDNYNLNHLPPERIKIDVESELAVDLLDLDKYMECLKEGFRIMTTDPKMKATIEDTLNSETVSGDTVLTVRMVFSLDKENNIDVSVDLVSCKKESLAGGKNTVAFGKEFENTMIGVPYITTLHAFSNYEEADKKLYIQENLYTSYAFREEVEAFVENYGTNKQEVSDLPTGEMLCIEFQDTYKSRYYYYGEGKWALASELYGDVKTFEVTDQAANDKFVDEMVARIALTKLSEEFRRAELISYDADSFYSEPKLSEEYKNANSQSVSYSLGYSTTWDFSIFRDDVDYLYSEKETFRTTNNNDGIMESTFNDYYEYAERGQDKYFRTSPIRNDYKETHDYVGKGSRYLLMMDPRAEYSFEYGFTATDGEKHINCEVYKTEGCRLTLLLDEEGMPFAGWKWLASKPKTEEAGKNFVQKGLTLLSSITTKHIDKDMDQIIDDIKTKAGTASSGSTLTGNTKNELLDAWRKENGLPDLEAQFVKGQMYTDSPVVQAFRDHLDQHEDFTAEFWTWEEYFCNHTSVTTKEQDFVYVDSAHLYDYFDEPLDSVWKTTGVELGMGNPDEIGDPGKNDHFWNTCSYGVVRWPVALTIFARDVFVQAYDATIDGEEYIIEEWVLKTGNARNKVEVIYFCKDGKIVGFREKEDGQLKTTYLMEFRDGTDESLFKADATDNT